MVGSARVRLDTRIATAFLTLLLVCGFGIDATEYAPWFGNVLEFEFRAAYSLQTYSRVDTTLGSTAVSADDHFLNLSLVTTPTAELSGEAELLLAHTSSQGFGIAHGRITARYLWLDDVVGDPVSFITGISLTVPTSQSQRDLSTPYHGDVEAELHIAVGREFCEGRYWTQRLWGLVAIGSANRGSPWVRANIYFEKNYRDTHRWWLFCHGLQGLGNQQLDLTDKFHSYRFIDHCSVDLGVGYSRAIEYCGRISVQYAHRVYACSFPEQTHTITLQFFYPFAY